MWESPGADRLIQEIKRDPEATYFPSGQLCIVGPNMSPELNRFFLAYKFDIYSVEPVSYYSVYVDAASNKVLLKISKLYNENADGIAVTMYSDTVQIVSDHFPGGFRLREDRNGVKIRTMNANNRTDNSKTINSVK